MRCGKGKCVVVRVKHLKTYDSCSSRVIQEGSHFHYEKRLCWWKKFDEIQVNEVLERDGHVEALGS